MKPNEFWDCTYREMSIYTQINLCKATDDLREEINVQEAVTDKLIMADAMSNKHPKVIPLHKTFEKLFPEEKKEQLSSPEEITRKMREIMKIQNNN